MSHRPSPLDTPAGRQSPFRRQNSASPATVRVASPASSPTKAPSALSPTKTSSLSPEKASPFVRRPSHINNASPRPASPFARPSSSLSIPAMPSRQVSNASNPVAPLSPSTAPSPRQATLVRTSAESDTRTLATSPPPPFDGAQQSSEDTPEDSPFFMPSRQTNTRPVAQRTTTSSTTATIKQPVFIAQSQTSAAPKLNTMVGGGAYSHMSQPLLHSMRESFEVLDSTNSGTLNSAAVSDMLSQLGLDNTPAALKDFFPPSAPPQLNLARYLDALCGPLEDLSQPDELKAAFEAFDVDDSGQIDISILRDALLHTAPQPGEDMIRLSEREVDGILSEFGGRRAFGAKGMNASKGKDKVFRYREFMASIRGNSGASGGDMTVAV